MGHAARVLLQKRRARRRRLNRLGRLWLELALTEPLTAAPGLIQPGGCAVDFFQRPELSRTATGTGEDQEPDAIFDGAASRIRRQSQSFGERYGTFAEFSRRPNVCIDGISGSSIPVVIDHRKITQTNAKPPGN